MVIITESLVFAATAVCYYSPVQYLTNSRSCRPVPPTCKACTLQLCVDFLVKQKILHSNHAQFLMISMAFLSKELG